MPYRRTHLFNNYYYHIFNRSFKKASIFDSYGNPSRALELLQYYRFKNIPMSFSRVLKLSSEHQEKIFSSLEKKKDLLVEIIAFCLMPNHFHLLLEQIQRNGIKTFIGNFQNSYAKYFNKKNERVGSLFQGRFKSVLIGSDSQLLHLSRYIHLNPYSSGIVKKRSELMSYAWSSFSEYIGKDTGFCKPKIILDQFKTAADYKEFVFDQADYQKKLEEIKHLAFE